MKKKILYLLLVLLLVVTCSFCLFACNTNDGEKDNGGSAGTTGNGGSKSEFASGVGTKESPYVLEKDYQWLNVAKHPDAYFELAKDINLGDYENVEPIGTSENPFTGVIDGKNHTVGGAKILSSQNAGLFGVVSGAKIKNLGFVDSSVKMSDDYGEREYMGSFVAIARKGALIENCYSKKVSIAFPAANTKYVYVGGFAGSVESSSSIICCNSNVQVSQANSYDYARFCIGGFARNVSGATLDCCSAFGSVSLGSPISLGNTLRVSGIVDKAENADITNMYSEMSCKGGSGIVFCYFGGDVSSTFKHCMNFGDYQAKYIERYVKCTTIADNDEYINLYFDSSSYSSSNTVLDNNRWRDNKYWVKGDLHPELVSYSEYLKMKESN